MQSFRLNLLSRIHFIVFLITGFLACTLLINLFLPDYLSEYWLQIFFLSFLLASLSVYWIGRKLSTQIVELTAHNDYLDVKWIKRPLFSSKQDARILWNDIDSFVYERLYRDYQLKINLKNGSVIRFLDDGYKLEGTKQLGDFYYFMRKKSSEFAVAFRKETKQIPLREGKPFMYTKIGTIIAFLSGILMIVGFILIPILSDDPETLREWKFGLLFIIILLVAGVLASIFRHKKAKKRTIKKTRKKTNQDPNSH
jgi:hypothetical protein